LQLANNPALDENRAAPQAHRRKGPEMPEMDFWYEFASTYSYLAAMRAEPMARSAGVRLRWRPFLLGPIFAAQGWNNSPFNIYPVKGRYMWRDMERLCAARGLVFRRPDPFPQNTLLAARLALAIPQDRRADFSRGVYRAEFADGRDISDALVLAGLLSEMGFSADELLARAKSDEVKAKLRAETEAAQAAGVFGAPAFVTVDGEMFWGDDRFEQALAWAGGKG
jgi:2-hydroxychromene-2-carboxylate isomerase